MLFGTPIVVKDMDMECFCMFKTRIRYVKRAWSTMFLLKLVYLAVHSDTILVTMLVGNKRDLADMREVSVEDATQYAEAEGLMFLETSALDATNVNAAFHSVMKEIYNSFNRKTLSSVSNKSEFVSKSEKIVLSSDYRDSQKNFPTCCSGSVTSS